MAVARRERAGGVADLDQGEAGLAGVWEPGGLEVEYAEPGGREVWAGLERLPRVDLGSCLPVRSFPSFKRQRNYPGWFWSATTGRLAGFESWVERGHLVARLRARGHDDRLPAVLAALMEQGAAWCRYGRLVRRS